MEVRGKGKGTQAEGSTPKKHNRGSETTELGGGILRPEDGPLLASLLFCVENSPLVIQTVQGLLQ